MGQDMVAALIVEAQRILLGQRSPTRAFYPNVWDLFGGHMEPGEEQQETLVRELQEELGITPTKPLYLETLHITVPKRRDVPAATLQVHLYLVPTWSGTPVNRQLHEHTAIQWFSLAQATQLALADPTYPELFMKYLTSPAARAGC